MQNEKVSKKSHLFFLILSKFNVDFKNAQKH